MNWTNQLIFWVPLVLTGIILLWLLYLEIKNGEVQSKTAGRALAVVIGIYLLMLATKIVYLYFQFKHDPLGQYLLPGKGTKYFYYLIWNICQPYIWSLLIGLGVLLILLILKKILKTPLFDRADIFIIILTIFVVGPSSVLVLIVGSFLWMLLIQLFYCLRQRELKTSFRLNLAPFLLLTALAIIILNNFAFYLNFLTLVKLT